MLRRPRLLALVAAAGCGSQVVMPVGGSVAPLDGATAPTALPDAGLAPAALPDGGMVTAPAAGTKCAQESRTATLAPVDLLLLGAIDFARVNVRVGGGAGPADLVYVERRERCDAAPDGWYYDVDPHVASPAKVQLCPGVCERLKADPKATIEVEFGCQSRVIQ